MSSRGALDLLTSYGDDTSDDDVPGPRVSTKRAYKNDEESDSKPTQRIKLPVPEIMFKTHQMNAHTDNPNNHGGRIRSFPHERGNWATYVYVAYESNSNMEELKTKLIKLSDDSNLSSIDHYHISLTKTVILYHHWIDSFVETIQQKMSCIPKFMIMFDTLQIYCNEERTRTFIGLQIRTGYDSLLNLIGQLDNCLAEFKLPCFYKDPSFHMSILWCTGDKEAELRSVLPEMNHIFEELVANTSADNWYIYVDHLQCKTGNKVFHFQLR